jgi:hypothetical protein
MEFWAGTKYSKWYKTHRRFSFTAAHCIELYEAGKRIPESVFRPFIKSLYCHSKAEEKFLTLLQGHEHLLNDHSEIQPTKEYSNDEKYNLCKSLLIHMKEEEILLKASLR